MKIPSKLELQRFVFNCLSDAAFKDFINLYKKKYCKTIFSLVIDTTLSSDNPLRFKSNLLERIWKTTIAIHDKIRIEKIQHNINRETEKLLVL